MFQNFLVTKLLTVEKLYLFVCLYSRKEAFVCSHYFINGKNNKPLKSLLLFPSQQERTNPKSKEYVVDDEHFQYPTVQRAGSINILNAKR